MIRILIARIIIYAQLSVSPLKLHRRTLLSAIGGAPDGGGGSGGAACRAAIVDDAEVGGAELVLTRTATHG